MSREKLRESDCVNKIVNLSQGFIRFIKVIQVQVINGNLHILLFSVNIFQIIFLRCNTHILIVKHLLLKNIYKNEIK
jgi:hypothetical protein